MTALSGHSRWIAIINFLESVSRLHGNILYIDPHFRFNAVALDADDNKFADCAIVAESDFIITSDHHFDSLISSGY
jgi:predicted nucleic acid-binding protein